MHALIEKKETTKQRTLLHDDRRARLPTASLSTQQSGRYSPEDSMS